MNKILRIVLAFSLTGIALLAADDGAAGSSQEPGVARISIVQGNVSVRRGDGGEASMAVVNGPLVSGDRLVTDEGSRAEVQFDSANMVRVAPMSEIRIGNLQDRRYEVQVAAGTVTYRLLRDAGTDTEIQMPSVSVRPRRAGAFRVTVLEDGSSEISVRLGEVEIFSSRGSEVLGAGRSMLARGSSDNPEVQVRAAVAEDEWDRWNLDRDRDLQRSVSPRYVSSDVYGAEELDSHGRWAYDPPYGNVWVPNVAADWAPYREGRWIWVDYYGWTWLSSDPWGWAPYHYGRWYRSSFGWSWYPGSRVGRQYWRPALVGFFGWGGGSGLSVGFGFSNVGWCPLAPYEPFRPWYGAGYYRGRNVVNNVTIVNNTNVVNVYRNARYNGVTSVRAGDFGHTQIHRQNFVQAPTGELGRAGSVHGAMPFTPSGASVRMSENPVRPMARPGNANAGENISGFYSRRSFEQRGGVVTGQQNTQPGRAASSPGATSSAGQGGWRRVDPGPASGQAGSAPQNSPGQGNPGGFRRFGAPARPAEAVQPGSSSPMRSEAPQTWRSFGATPRVSNSDRPSPSGQQPASAYRQAPSAVQERPAQTQMRSAPMFGGQPEMARPQQSIRISPPMVQERRMPMQAPQVDSHRDNFGGAHASGPAPNRPAATQMRQPSGGRDTSSRPNRAPRGR